MEKNVAFFKRTEKNGTFRTEKNAVPNPGDISNTKGTSDTVLSILAIRESRTNAIRKSYE